MSDIPHSSDSANWEQLARFVAGDLPADERAAFQRELDANPARAELLRTLTAAVRVDDPAPPTAAETEAALALVLARRDDGAAPRTPVIMLDAHRPAARTFPWRAAAAVLLVAGAGLLYRSASRSAGVQPAGYATAVGAIDSVTLSDGTRVLLGPGSRLTVASGFGTTVRDVALSGEAKFSVTHDAAHPFTVHAGGATFRDVGTVFSVHSDAQEGARIVVSEGAVAVQGRAGDTEVTLHAGDRAAIADAGAVTVQRAAADSNDLAWTAGRLVFTDAPITRVAADLRRWFGIELHVDSAFAGRTLNAAFSARDPSSDVGRIIAATLGGGLVQDGNILRIVPAPAASQSK